MSETLTQERVRGSGGGSAFEGGAVAKRGYSGQLVATGELTDQQEAYCRTFIENGGNGNNAAEVAGYTSEPRSIVYHNMKLPKIRARIHELAELRLEVEGAVVGVGVLIAIAKDEDAPPGVRAKCAIKLCEGAGLFKDRPADGTNARKSLAEMTREELEAVVAQGAAVLTAASKIGPVLTARVAQDKAQVTDAESIEAIPDNAE